MRKRKEIGTFKGRMQLSKPFIGVTTSCILCKITRLNLRKGFGIIESVNPGKTSGKFQIKYLNGLKAEIGMRVYALIAKKGGTKRGLARYLVAAFGKDYISEERI